MVPNLSKKKKKTRNFAPCENYPLCSITLICTCNTGHSCKKPGCGSALVFDGNLKNHRDVCFAADAGYAEFKGLEGQVRVGCQNTPSYKSRYCELHKPKPISTSPTENGAQNENTDNQLGIIVGKRVTRSSVLYEVCDTVY